MSNITSITGNYDRQAYVSDAAEQKKEVNEKQPVEPRKDNSEVKVSLSSDSKDLQTAKQAAASAPERGNTQNRPDKVEALKQQVEEGGYQVNPMQVAEKIVGGVIDEIV